MADDQKETDTFFITQLWKRKVVQIIVAYLVGCWTVIEVVSFLLEHYRISPYWIDILFMFFITILPSVLYFTANRDHLATNGFTKKYKLISTINLVMAFSIIFFSFGGKDLGSVTKNITYVDEAGQQVTQKVYKEEFKTSVQLLPFENKVNVDSLLWLSPGIMLLLEFDIGQFPYLYGNIPLISNSDQEAHDMSFLSEKIDRARSLGFSYMVTGSYAMAKGKYSISFQLYNTKSARLVREETFTSDRLLPLLDSATVWMQEGMNISNHIVTSYADLTLSDMYSHNEVAVKYFCQGLLGMGKRFELLDRAISLDSTFANAYLAKAVIGYSSLAREEVKFSAGKAYQYRKRLPSLVQNTITAWYYAANGEMEKSRRLLESFYQSNPRNHGFIRTLNDLSRIANKTDEAVYWAKKGLDLAYQDHQFEYGIWYINQLITFDAPSQALDEVDRMIEVNPENEMWTMLKGLALMCDKRYDDALNWYDEYLLTNPEKKNAKIMKVIAESLSKEPNKTLVDAASGHYRSDRSESLDKIEVRDGFLVGEAYRSIDVFFPFKDGLFVDGGTFGTPSSIQFVLNERKEVLKYLIHYGRTLEELLPESSMMTLGPFWKQDKAFWRIEEMIRGHHYGSASPILDSLIVQHPEHYYLYNYRSHLDHVVKISKEELSDNANLLTGTYEDDRKVWRDGNDLYFSSKGLGRIRLYALHDNKFCSTSMYCFLWEMVSEGDIVKGIQMWEYNHQMNSYQPSLFFKKM